MGFSVILYHAQYLLKSAYKWYLPFIWGQSTALTHLNVLPALLQWLFRVMLSD